MIFGQTHHSREQKETLNDILKNPTKDKIEVAAANLKDNLKCYFFDKSENPEWI